MVVSTVKQAWEEAGKMLETNYVKNKMLSYRIGYPTYMSTANNNNTIDDLDARLKVTVGAEVTNIWIAPLCTEELGENIEEEIEEIAEKISDYIRIVDCDLPIRANEHDKNTIFQIAVQALKKIKNATCNSNEWGMFCNEAAVKLNKTIEGCNAYLTMQLPLREVARKWEKERVEKLTNRIKDKEEMLHSDFGRQLKNIVTAWDKALNRDSEETVDYCMTYWKATKLALQFMYDKEYHFFRNDNDCGIVSDDEEWLIKVR